MKKKDLLTYLDEIIEKQVTDYDVALDWDTKIIRSKSLFVCLRKIKHNLRLMMQKGSFRKNQLSNLKMAYSF